MYLTSSGVPRLIFRCPFPEPEMDVALFLVSERTMSADRASRAVFLMLAPGISLGRFGPAFFSPLLLPLVRSEVKMHLRLLSELYWETLENYSPPWVKDDSLESFTSQDEQMNGMANSSPMGLLREPSFIVFQGVGDGRLQLSGTSGIGLFSVFYFRKLGAVLRRK